ncbi:MAG TPA: efflux RND transporter periplasmic adaptor subunit [Methylobacter sp.]|jgi:multidrug efflux system membrane fusion protein
MKKETHMLAVIHRLMSQGRAFQTMWHEGISINKKLFNGLLASLSLTMIIGCGSHDNSAPQPGQGHLPNVKIAQPLSQEVTEWDEYTGRIEAVNSVDVRARVSGYLEKVNFKAGDKVHKGDLLFQIDPKPFSAQLNYAEAELERAKSRHELAKNDLARAERLFRAKAISEEEHDSRSKGLREAVAAVQSAQANVYTAWLNLEFTQVRSPIDGRIGRELITAGNVVSDGGADATLLTFIVSTDPVYVYVDVDERSVLKYRRQAQKDGRGSLGDERTPVELAVADEVDFPHQGHLDYISPREDAATGTLTLRGVFVNPDELLSPGFFARMRIRGSAPYPAILVPDRTIGTDQAQSFVWVVNQENQVEYRKVALGAHIGQSRVIIKGLKPEEWTVIEGIQKLKPGIKVNPERISLTERNEKK